MTAIHHTRYIGDDVAASFDGDALCIQIDGVRGTEIYLTRDTFEALLRFVVEVDPPVAQ